MPREKRKVPWLETRGSEGSYYVFWYDEAKHRTERFSLRTTDPVEAANRYAAFLTQGRSVYSGGQSAGLTCGVALDYYLDEHVEKGPVVAKDRQRNSVKNLKLFFDTQLVKDIGIPDSRSYAEQRMGGALGGKNKGNGKTRAASAGTVKRELGVLQAAINHCIAWKKPGVSRADEPTFEKPRTAISKGLWLFPDELQKLRATAGQQIRDFIDLAYWTAARRRSVETLTWFQVDLNRGRINLAKPGEPVTKKRKPIVKIDPPLLPVLKRLYESKTNHWVLGSDTNVSTAFLKVLQQAGLRDLPARDMRPPGKASPHILRHSYATHALNAGAKPKAVADRLGDTVMTVVRVYGHACPDFGDVAENEQER